MDERRQEMNALIEQAAQHPLGVSGLGYYQSKQLLQLVEQVIGTGEEGRQWRLHQARIDRLGGVVCAVPYQNPALRLANELIQKVRANSEG